LPGLDDAGGIGGAVNLPFAQEPEP
jgi:hypothetical protein